MILNLLIEKINIFFTLEILRLLIGLYNFFWIEISSFFRMLTIIKHTQIIGLTNIRITRIS